MQKRYNWEDNINLQVFSSKLGRWLVIFPKKVIKNESAEFRTRTSDEKDSFFEEHSLELSFFSIFSFSFSENLCYIRSQNAVHNISKPTMTSNRVELCSQLIKYVSYVCHTVFQQMSHKKYKMEHKRSCDNVRFSEQV